MDTFEGKITKAGIQAMQHRIDNSCTPKEGRVLIGSKGEICYIKGVIDGRLKEPILRIIRKQFNKSNKISILNIE